MPKIKFEDTATVTEKKVGDAQIIETIQKKEELSEFVEVTDLPSKFKFYPAGTKIFVRPFSVKDVKALANMTADEHISVINNILTKNLRGIPVNSLFVSDKYYLIFFLRALTYKDAAYSVNFNCDHCLRDDSFAFGVDLLDVDYVKDDVDLTFTLPVSKQTVKLQYKTVADELKIEEFIKINGININEFDEDIFRIAYDIKSVNNEELSPLKRYEFVLKMKAADFTYLVSYMDKIDFGVIPEIKAKCSKCGGTTPVGVNFSREFFIPRIQF